MEPIADDSARVPQAPETPMTDELLQPSVTAPPPGARPPWRIRSQFWLAFFGGPLPVTVIAFLNARRLRLGSRERMQIIIAGAIAVAAELTLVYFSPEIAEWMKARQATAGRLTLRFTGMLLYLVLARIQGPADRLRNLGNDVHYDSLWGPGFAAWIGLGIVQAGLVAAALLTRL